MVLFAAVMGETPLQLDGHFLPPRICYSRLGGSNSQSELLAPSRSILPQNMLSGNILAGISAYNCYGMARNIVGPRVRLARKLSQPPLTQGELAARLQVLGLEVEQSSVSKIEQGLRPVSDMEVMVLAKALNVTVGWLLGEGNASSSTFKHE